MTTDIQSKSKSLPPEPPGPLIWIRKNLFNNWYNSILTIGSSALIAVVLFSLFRWIFFLADWRPVTTAPLLYLVGQYPRDQLWRLGLILIIMSLLFGASWRKWGGVMRTFSLTYAVFLIFVALWPSPQGGLPLQLRLFMLANLAVILLGYKIGGYSKFRGMYLALAWLLSLAGNLLLLHGSDAFGKLDVVSTTLWGGLLVTLLLAIGGITLSFPIGLILALGRQSSLPVFRWICTIIIEVVRGVPLIGLLFLSSLILPLFLPPEIRIDRLLRALLGMIIFSAAYMAENVRGGLAAVPHGQVEAAKALGHNGFQITGLIVLPQALRAVIPPIVGQFISLFKDTTLANGVAVLELLSVGRSIVQSTPEFIGLQMEVYAFIALIFWIFSYMMSNASQQIEVALGVGER